MESKSVLLVGVGGQGAILTAKILVNGEPFAAYEDEEVAQDVFRELCEECCPSTPGRTKASWFMTVMTRSVVRPIIV